MLTGYCIPEDWQLNALVYGLKCRVSLSHGSYRIGHDKVEMTRKTLLSLVHFFLELSRNAYILYRLNYLVDIVFS